MHALQPKVLNLATATRPSGESFTKIWTIVSLVAGAVGIVVLRLRGHYFSIATLGVGVAMPQVITSDVAFGPHGLFPNFFGGGLPLNFPLAPDIRIGEQTLDADRFFLRLDRGHDGEIDPDDIDYYETVLAPEIRTGGEGGMAAGRPSGGARRGGLPAPGDR